MKTFKLIILCCCYAITCSCQKQEFSKKTPILIERIGKDKPTFDSKKNVIVDNKLNDSLKVIYQVIVEFKHPFRDLEKEVTVESVKIYRMSIRSLDDKSKIVMNSSYNNPRDELVWILCSDKFNEWYRNQPYNDFPYREMEGKKVVFGGVVYLLPYVAENNYDKKKK